MSDQREAGDESALPPAIIHPGIPKPPRRPFAGLGERATLMVLGGALVLGVAAWAATRGGGDDGGLGLPIPGLKRDDGADRAITQMGRLADRLCACKDVQCSEGVMKDMSSMREPSGKPTKAQMDRAMKIAEKMAECQRKLMEAEATTDSDPDL